MSFKLRHYQQLFSASADDFRTKPLDVKRFLDLLESVTTGAAQVERPNANR